VCEDYEEEKIKQKEFPIMYHILTRFFMQLLYTDTIALHPLI